MIDIKYGSIKIKNRNLIINKKLTKYEFVNSDLFNDVFYKDDYGYTFYQIKPQFICGNEFRINMYFKPEGLLESVRLALYDSNDSSDNDYWSNWSEEKELKKQIIHNRLLREQIGAPPYKYSWGEISSLYDPRSASSSICILYKSWIRRIFAII